MNLKRLFQKSQIEEENHLKPLIVAIDNLSNIISSQTGSTKIEKEYINIENPIDEDLKSEIKLLQIQLDTVKKERDHYYDKINNNEQFISDEELRNRYIQLLDFAFRNIDPFTNIDILQARHYYESIIKK
jgi:hypothetical protein